MASKDLRPEQRLGRGINPKKIKMIFWAVGLLACSGGLYAAYHYASATEVMAHIRGGGHSALLLDQDAPDTPARLAEGDWLD